MGVKKPSVDWAISRLAEAGLVLHEKYRDVDLTAEGARIAADIHHRHKTLRRFLVEILHVEEETADNEACRIEHILSRSSLSRLERFTDSVLDCPQNNHDWLKTLNSRGEHGKQDAKLSAGCLSKDEIEQKNLG
jgi:DtxR family Mn-dependent transcriptional regulator